MDFLIKIRDTVHGWSEETRKFLAMATMGIGILVFFSVWISSLSSGLVAIAPSAPTVSAPVAEVFPPPNPVAFLPPSDTSGGESLAGNTVPVPADMAPALLSDQNIPQIPVVPPAPITQNALPSAEPIPTEQVPTPMQGVAETFGGIRQLFRTTESSDTIEGRLRVAGSWVWNTGMNIISWAQNFLLWFGGVLYQRISTLIAS